MSDFIGAKCFICGEEFTKDSDIVVCPECGTPYHRECYNKEGHCINDRLHSENGSWYDEREHEKKAEKEKKICSQCGFENHSDSDFCENCGNRISSHEISGGTRNYGGINLGNFSINLDKYCGYNPDEEIDGVKISELADFVGNNTYYYLPIFKRMSETGKKISFNLTCLFFPDYYFANRKIYKLWVFALLFSFIISVPSTLYKIADYNILSSTVEKINMAAESLQNFSFVCSILLYAFRICMCLFGNWIYYRYAVRKIKNIKNNKLPGEILKRKITESGGVELKNIFINFLIQMSLSFFFVALLVILA